MKFTTCSKGYRPTKDSAEIKPGVIKPSRKISKAYIPGLLKLIPKSTFRSSDIIYKVLPLVPRLSDDVVY